MSSRQLRPDAIASPNWISGSLFMGAAVGILLGIESTLNIGIAIGIGLASILISIGLVAEKIVTASPRLFGSNDPNAQP